MNTNAVEQITFAIFDFDSGDRVGTKVYKSVSGAQSALRAAYTAQPTRRFTIQKVGWTK